MMQNRTRMAELTARYNDFWKRHREVLFGYFSLLIDLAEARGIKPSGTPEAIRAVANVIGSEGDHNTRCLAALVIGALESI